MIAGRSAAKNQGCSSMPCLQPAAHTSGDMTLLGGLHESSHSTPNTPPHRYNKTSTTAWARILSRQHPPRPTRHILIPVNHHMDRHHNGISKPTWKCGTPSHPSSSLYNLMTFKTATGLPGTAGFRCNGLQHWVGILAPLAPSPTTPPQNRHPTSNIPGTQGNQKRLSGNRQLILGVSHGGEDNGTGSMIPAEARIAVLKQSTGKSKPPDGTKI